MKKLLLFIFFAGTISAVHAQDKAFARKVIDTLSSEEFHGRGYVDNGDGLSAKFIADIFDTLKLNELSDSYYQKFEVNVNTLPSSLKVVVDRQKLEPGIDYLVDPASPPVKGSYDLVWVSEKDLENPGEFFKNIKKSEKTFFVFSDYNKKDKDVENLINFLKFDPGSPVAGIIEIIPDKLTWHGATWQMKRPVLNIRKGAISANASKISLNVKSEFLEGYKTQNVIGSLKGKSDSIILVTAHYDHLGRMGKKTYFPGANDNASGTAFMLDLARHYSKGDSLPYTMVFIAFAAEEIGLLGSKHFVNNPLIPLKKIKFLLNFDLAGTGDEGIQVVNGSEFKEQFDMLQELNDQDNLLPQVKVRGEACNSDHCPFYEKGVPGFFIYTLGGIKAYHDTEDLAKTLPLTEYEDYFLLMTKFIDSL